MGGVLDQRVLAELTWFQGEQRPPNSEELDSLTVEKLSHTVGFKALGTGETSR